MNSSVNNQNGMNEVLTDDYWFDMGYKDGRADKKPSFLGDSEFQKSYDAGYDEGQEMLNCAEASESFEIGDWD